MISDIGHTPLHGNDVTSAVGRLDAPPVLLRHVPIGLEFVVGFHPTGADVADALTRFSKRPIPRILPTRGPDVWHWLANDCGGVFFVAAAFGQDSSAGWGPKDPMSGAGGHQQAQGQVW